MLATRTILLGAVLLGIGASLDCGCAAAVKPCKGIARSGICEGVLAQMDTSLAGTDAYEDQGVVTVTAIVASGQREIEQRHACAVRFVRGSGFRFAVGKITLEYDGNSLLITDAERRAYCLTESLDWRGAVNHPVIADVVLAQHCLPPLALMANRQEIFADLFSDLELECKEQIEGEECWVFSGTVHRKLMQSRSVSCKARIWLRASDGLPRRLWVDLSRLKVDYVEGAHEGEPVEHCSLLYDMRGIRVGEDVRTAAFQTQVPPGFQPDSRLIPR